MKNVFIASVLAFGVAFSALATAAWRIAAASLAHSV